MDRISGGNVVSFDSRDCARGERFIVLAGPFYVIDSYATTIVLGANRIEAISIWVVDMTAYKQKFAQYFRVVA